MSYDAYRGRQEVEIDQEELATTLEDNNLAGLVDVSRLLIADGSLRTYQQLIAVLSTKNKFGNFQFETGNVSLAHSIMDSAQPGMDPPKAYNLVVSREIIVDLIPVIADLQQETARRLAEVEALDDGAEEPEEGGGSVDFRMAA